MLLESLQLQILDPDSDDTGGASKGFKVVTIRAFIDDQEVGYIKLSYIPKQTWNDKFENNILTFAYRWKGWAFNTETLSGLESYTMPRGATNYTKDEMIAKAHTLLDDSKNQVKNYHVNKPLVDYINVYESHRRQGIGTKLYYEAAKWCQQNNMELHASGIQSGLAKSAWKKMETMHDRKVVKRGDRRVLLVDII